MEILTKFNIDDRVWFYEEIYEDERCPHCDQILPNGAVKKKVKVEGQIISFHYSITRTNVSCWYKVHRIPGFYGAVTSLDEDRLHLVT